MGVEKPVRSLAVEAAEVTGVPSAPREGVVVARQTQVGVEAVNRQYGTHACHSPTQTVGEGAGEAGECPGFLRVDSGRPHADDVCP